MGVINVDPATSRLHKVLFPVTSQSDRAEVANVTPDNSSVPSESSNLYTVTILISTGAAIGLIATAILIACIVNMKRRRTRKQKVVAKYDNLFTTLRRPSPFSVISARRQLSDPIADRRSTYSTFDIVTERPQFQETDTNSREKQIKQMDKPLEKIRSFEGLGCGNTKQPKLLQRSQSMTSLIGITDESVPNISFSLKNVTKSRQLQLKLHSVKNLPLKAYGFDVLVSVYVFPRNTDGVHSRCIVGSKACTFQETFLFDDMKITEVEKSTLRLVVNYKRKSKASKEGFLGELFVKCCDIEWTAAEPVRFDSVALQTRSKNGSTSEKYLFEDLGSLFVCVEYQSAANRMKVMVRKASHLPKSDKLIGRPGHYVVINLLKDGQQVDLRETKTQNGHSPVWNQPFLFNLTGNDVNCYSVDFVIMRCKIHTKDAVVGHVKIGNRGTKSGRAHWKEVVSPRISQMAQWHSIYPVFTFKQTPSVESTE